MFSGSQQIGSTTASSGGSFSITVSSSLPDGTYIFTLTATDAANNVSSSSSISHTINTSGSGGGNGGGESGGGGGGYSPGY